MAMQLVVYVNLEEPLVLPINYHHILQAIIYDGLSITPDYSEFLHEIGYTRGQRQYKLFQFSQLEGPYQIREKKIIFTSHVTFEVRSPEPLLIRLLGSAFWTNGIRFGKRAYMNIEMELYDYTIENTDLLICMKSPIIVYETDLERGETHYISPDDTRFYQLISHNFFRKYEAYYGVSPCSDIEINLAGNHKIKKYVTRYQGSYLTGWYGTYRLSGERKYLDFLYQSGLGSKNAQGFGMFEVL